MFNALPTFDPKPSPIPGVTMHAFTVSLGRLYIDPIQGIVLKYYPNQGVTKEFGFRNKKGYHIITIRNHPVPRAKIIWHAYYGEWPTRNVKHRNNVAWDDRIENLFLSDS